MPPRKRMAGQTRGKLPGHDTAPAAATELAMGVQAETPSPRKRFASTKVEVEGREEIKIVELPDLEPAPWGDDATLGIVGQRVPRADALEKVTGRARYTADVVRPAMLHAAFVRAPVASGRLHQINLERALALPGVRGALVAADVPGVMHGGAPLFDATIHW